jgi:DNA processing protein
MIASSRASSAEERIAWLRLARTDTIGPATFASLLARFGTALEAVDAAPHLARLGGRDFKLARPEDAQREDEAVAARGGRILLSCDADYPDGLKALEAPPPALTVFGKSDLLRRDMIGIVGARNASALGVRFAERMAKDLGEAGLVIASGLARGIDAAAHRASLETGTVAVVAGGADSIYPPENAALHETLCARGAVVSEMPLGQPPLARHFPRRNRIISGLSRGIVVIEAAERSGSLITANYALEQGREVFAVPGSPLDPRAKGSNRLLREGATLTECAEDVLGVMAPVLSGRFAEAPTLPEPLPAADVQMEETSGQGLRERVAEGLSPAPVEVDILIRLTGGPAREVLTILLELELAGRVARHPGG